MSLPADVTPDLSGRVVAVLGLGELMGNDVHDGRKRLRVTVTLHPTKGKAIRSSFDFSRDPGYGFVPSAAP